MGHLINPISFRLGKSRQWNSVWFADPTSVVYSSLVKSDWVLFLFFRRFFDSKLFFYNGYIFSHVKVIREGAKICCTVYFYDGGFIEKSETLTKFLLSRKNQRVFLQNISAFTVLNFLRIFKFSYLSASSSFSFNQFLLFYFFLHRKKSFLKFKLNTKKYQLQKQLKFLLKNLVKFFLLSLFKFFSLKIKYNEKLSYFFKYMILTKNDFFYMLKLLNLLNQSSFFSFRFIKILFQKILFYFHTFITFLKFLLIEFTLISSLLKQFAIVFFITLHKFFSINKALKVIQHKSFIHSFNMLKFYIYKRVILLRSFLKSGIGNFLYLNRYFTHFLPEYFFVFSQFQPNFGLAAYIYLSRVFGKKFSDNMVIFWKMLDYENVTAQIVANYMTIRLRQRFQLREVLMPILRSLILHPTVLGFRITCAGRFTKKEIAVYDLRTFSSVPFSGVLKRLDYGFSEVVLKYSICGIKVWLHKRMRIVDFNLPKRNNYEHFGDLFNLLYNFNGPALIPRQPSIFESKYLSKYLKFYKLKVKNVSKLSKKHLLNFMLYRYIKPQFFSAWSSTLFKPNSDFFRRKLVRFHKK
jgi:hypothetical protein